jgi:hypothetical protein
MTIDVNKNDLAKNNNTDLIKKRIKGISILDRLNTFKG